MEYYVKPTPARTPDHLILHVGTNDVRQSTPQEITNAISMLGQQIKKELPTTNLAISEVITRNDDPSLNTKITELNTKLSQFKNYNSHQFKEELSYYTNLDPTSNDPNVLWNEFKNNFLTIAEKHAPVRQRRVKSEHKPWLTKEIKRLMHHRDYLKRQSLNVDDQVITGDTNIADCFNQYFSSIGCKLSKNVQNINVDPMTFVTPTESSFHFSCISVQETFDALNQLNSRKSPGLDGISVKLLKDTSDVIAQPLANIFNLSLQTAIFPDEWKIAKVSPVFKEGNKTDCGKYRPISVISVVAKLFEGLVYNQLRTFIADNSILVEQQSGFRSQHSTETALLGSTNEWLYNMDSGLINGVLFLDLKKAFDTVDHEILLKKLHLYGIKGTTYAWFESYIQNRKSICLMNGKKSHAREIRCGVPQGSNLGPILFLLYINDLPKCLETTKANLFADDTNLSCAGLDANEIETKLKRDLENVHSWLRCNKLTLNDSKTEFMIIGSRHHLTKFEDNPEISLAIRDNNIKRVTNKKSLGFIIDDQLNEILSGYNIFRRDRIDRVGGGILVVIKADIKSTRRSDLERKSVELVGVELSRPDSRSFLLYTFYHPPDSLPEVLQHLNLSLQKGKTHEAGDKLDLPLCNCPETIEKVTTTPADECNLSLNALSLLNAKSSIITRQISKACATPCPAYGEYLTKIEKSLNSNLKTFWSYHKAMLHQRTNHISAIIHKGVTATNSIEKAELLNAYFTSVCSKPTANPDYANFPNYQEFCAELAEFQLTADEVLAYLNSLDTSKACGADGIPARLLKEYSFQIAPSLCGLFNYS
ncbi:Hypothetical predicted protein [Paramuricea clavata]|uniref:Uncharacterized protein n=1 Tax=Paramuricea clavata TaxID=317549 RepID=A0A6S7IHR1_PARCT|nr:Hypothetical predicted protein [Paramuricea clavata]